MGLVIGGCSDDEGLGDENEEILGPGGSGTQDTSEMPDVPSVTDAGDTSGGNQDDADQPDARERDIVQSDAVEQADSFEGFDIGGDDAEIPLFSGTCEQVTDLGVLEPGAQSIEYTVDAQNDFIKTSCSPSGSTTAEKIYQFQTDQPLDLSTSGGSNINVELRSEPCGEQASVITCNPDGDLQDSLSPNVTYYLLVEADGAADGDTVTFEVEANSPFGGCQAGSSSCVSSDTVEICEQGGLTEQYACPEGCDGQEDACAGDRCAAPIDVSTTKRVQGDLEAYTNEISTYTGCTNSSQSGPVSANGPEVTFSLPGLIMGQIIDVDTSRDDIDNVILIQETGCGEQASCVVPDESTAETATFTVDAPGDYTVIVDAESASSGSFDYEVVLR